MRKGLLWVVIASIAAFLFYWFGFRDTTKRVKQKETPITVNASDSLTGDIGLSLKAYYAMKDGFTKSDTSIVNQSASEFVTRVTDISMDSIKADDAVVELGKQLKTNMAVETQKIIAAADIKEKRMAFQVVSDNLFDLLRMVRYSGSKVYQQYCPMAFDSRGAAWLSGEAEIVNPYFGEKMLECGEIRDSVNLVKN